LLVALVVVVGVVARGTRGLQVGLVLVLIEFVGVHGAEDVEHLAAFVRVEVALQHVRLVGLCARQRLLLVAVARLLVGVFLPLLLHQLGQLVFDNFAVCILECVLERYRCVLLAVALLVEE